MLNIENNGETLSILDINMLMLVKHLTVIELVPFILCHIKKRTLITGVSQYNFD